MTGRRTRKALLLVLANLALAVAQAVATIAGTVVDYPEFPYSATNYTEPFRGQFHFSSRGGWMNDIDAPLYYKGTYHIFYQHNPHGLIWDTMHWGHATSTDLIHWVQKPIALEPGVHPGNLWSGAGVVDTNNTSGLRTGIEDPIVVFTGTNGVIVAYSNDAGRTFQSYNAGQPIVTPAGTSRDAKVFRHSQSNQWVMVVWSADAVGNGVNIYTSPDLLNWTFQSRYSASWLYECPDLFPLAVDGNPATTKWVMNDASGKYVIGDFSGTTYTPDWTSPQLMDQGRNTYNNGTFYAGQTFNNMPNGRIVQMVWMPSNNGSVWTGNATFPVDLALKTFPEGIRITRNPITEISSIRTSTSSWSNQTITTDPASDPLAGISADTYEITAEFDLAGATASQFGFYLHSRTDGTYDRSVLYNLAAQTLYGAPLASVNGRVRVHLLVDRGQLEIFGNDGKLSYTDNVNFNSSLASQGIHLFAQGGNVQLVSLQLSPLGAVWGTGESTLESNLPGPWHAVNGAWTDVAGGKQGTHTADAFYLSNQTGTNFNYEGDVRVVNGVAAALTFRASADATQHYTVNVDTTGVVKLWRPGQVIATYPTTIVVGQRYHLRVVANGSSIKVYLNNGVNPVIDAVDTTYSGGYFGVNLYNGTGEFQNVNANTGGFCTNIAANWHPLNGTWSEPVGRKRGTNSSDGFYLSDQTGTDFSYEGDVRVLNGQAAALTFRASADATQHYTANVDTTGVVKLWRPGQVIAMYSTPIVMGRTYHLRVVANGSSIKVYLNNISNPVIDAVDTTYSSGVFGVNLYNGTSEFQNVKVNAGSFCTNLNATWNPINGTWTDVAGGKQGTHTADAFYLSNQTGTNFNYEGDVRVVNGVAAALTFRASADATQHYTVNVDTTGVVKLWRPGQVIATYPTTIVVGQRYRLRVFANGSSIKVYLNNSVNPVIDAVDTTYSSGYFGVNLYNGTAEFQGLTVFGT